MSKSTCYVCNEEIEGTPVVSENCRTGNIWHSHDDCLGPTPDSYAATARLMAAGDDSDFDWDAWKDEQKEGDL